jgi:hypothetical protein
LKNKFQENLEKTRNKGKTMKKIKGGEKLTFQSVPYQPVNSIPILNSE